MNKNLNLKSFNLSDLNKDEIVNINGGDVGKQLGKAVGKLAGYCVDFAEGFYKVCTMAAEFQASLPPNLKK